MKQILFTLAFLCFAVTMSAQSIGIRVGFNFTDANIDRDGESLAADAKGNVAFGVFGLLPIGETSLKVQPEVAYVKRGYEFNSLNDSNDLLNINQTTNHLDLGVLLRYDFNLADQFNLYLGVGPKYTYALSGELEFLGDTQDIDWDEDRINRGEFQFTGLVGTSFDLGVSVFLEARYDGSLSNQYDRDDYDVKQHSIGVHAGVLIPLGKY